MSRRLAPERMYPAGVPGITVRRVTLRGGLSLRVAESGGTVHPPVVLLHGWGASMYMWRAWFTPLARAGLRAIAIDLPGHGLSDKPEGSGAYALERQVEALREFLVSEHLTGAAVVAQSMGGTIALELALQPGTPIGRLVLINAACFGRVGLLVLARIASPPLIGRVLHRLVPRWVVARAHRFAYARPSRITESDVDEYWAPSQFPGYARAMRRLLHEFHWDRESPDLLAARLRRLPHPPFVVLGHRDAIVRDSAAYVHALRVRGVPMEILELADSGHAANEEEPEALIGPVLRYLGATPTAP